MDNSKLEELKKLAQESIREAQDTNALNDVRVRFLGKKGEITSLLKSMKDLSAEEKPKFGQLVNALRQQVEEELQEHMTELQKKARDAKMAAETIDVTLPAKKMQYGHAHPNTKALEEVERIFIGMGYEVVEGPEVEYDEYNFEKLNIPKGHPARDEQDTFYIGNNILLRTQTSSVQARVMEKGKLPIRMICPGRVFRSDAVDATHSPSFHQIEGLVIDKHVTFADLKGTLDTFAKECGGKGCRFCKGEGWIEILGCGMVHPHVLEMCGIDPNEYQGFAFGVGLERIALLKYEIDDMRLLYENDTRFLNQY